MSCNGTPAGSVVPDQVQPTVPAVQEYLETLFGPNKSKSEILEGLGACTALHRIPLSPPSVTIAQAQKDFKRERVLLNDVAFIPDKDDDDRAVAFDLTLRTLLQRLMRSHTVYDTKVCADYNAAADLIMQRACRTSAGADSFFTIQKLFCVESTFVSQNTTVSEDPPIHIDVFLSDQCNFNRASGQSTMSSVTDSNGTDDVPHLCARMLVSNSFSVYDTACMAEDWEDLGTEPAPWLEIDSIVVDESDLRTGDHWRKLHLVACDPTTGRTYSSTDSDAEATNMKHHALYTARRRHFDIRGLTSWLSPCTSSHSASSTNHTNTPLEDDDWSAGNSSVAKSSVTNRDDLPRPMP